MSTPLARAELRVTVRLLRWDKERARAKHALVARSFANRHSKGLLVTKGTMNQAGVSRGKIKVASNRSCGPKTIVGAPWPVSKVSRSDSPVPGDNQSVTRLPGGMVGPPAKDLSGASTSVVPEGQRQGSSTGAAIDRYQARLKYTGPSDTVEGTGAKSSKPSEPKRPEGKLTKGQKDRRKPRELRLRT